MTLVRMEISGVMVTVLEQNVPMILKKQELISQVKELQKDPVNNNAAMMKLMGRIIRLNRKMGR